ncbi:hypothetical protein BH10PSE15_BH10PSE15_03830 [soil metagenome]
MPLWCALAELFLDTDLPGIWIPGIARAIVDGGWTLAEADHALRWEVRPAFYFNALDLAGEWAGWRDEDVRRLVLAARAPPWLKRMVLGRNRFMPEYWPEILAEVARLRA